MIVVEGPDGAGKTTLVRKLQEEFGLTEGARGTSNRKLLYTVTVPDTMRALADAVYGRREYPTQVWDRLYYSELVYADIVGRPIEFTDAQQSHVQSIVGALHCPVILCLPPLNTVIANVLATKDDQMSGVVENTRTIYHRYEQLFQDDVFPENTLLYDYTRQDPHPDHPPLGFSRLEEIVADVKDYIEAREARAWD